MPAKPFEFDPEPSPVTRGPVPPGTSWLKMFSATFAGVLLAGVILLVGLRYYVYYSLAEAVQKINAKHKD